MSSIIRSRRLVVGAVLIIVQLLIVGVKGSASSERDSTSESVAGPGTTSCHLPIPRSGFVHVRGTCRHTSA
jgi:hypothetical protein